jgi:hypothetical protein
MGIASLIKEMSGRNISVTDPTHCINKAILCSGNNHVNHVSEEVLKISVDIGTGLLRRYISQWSVFPSSVYLQGD